MSGQAHDEIDTYRVDDDDRRKAFEDRLGVTPQGTAEYEVLRGEVSAEIKRQNSATEPPGTATGFPRMAGGSGVSEDQQRTSTDLVPINKDPVTDELLGPDEWYSEGRIDEVTREASPTLCERDFYPRSFWLSRPDLEETFRVALECDVSPDALLLLEDIRVACTIPATVAIQDSGTTNVLNLMGIVQANSGIGKSRLGEILDKRVPFPEVTHWDSDAVPKTGRVDRERVRVIGTGSGAGQIEHFMFTKETTGEDENEKKKKTTREKMPGGWAVLTRSDEGPELVSKLGSEHSPLSKFLTLKTGGECADPGATAETQRKLPAFSYRWSGEFLFTPEPMRGLARYDGTGFQQRIGVAMGYTRRWAKESLAAQGEAGWNIDVPAISLPDDSRPVLDHGRMFYLKLHDDVREELAILRKMGDPEASAIAMLAEMYPDAFQRLIEAGDLADDVRKSNHVTTSRLTLAAIRARRRGATWTDDVFITLEDWQLAGIQVRLWMRHWQRHFNDVRAEDGAEQRLKVERKVRDGLADDRNAAWDRIATAIGQRIDDDGGTTSKQRLTDKVTKSMLDALETHTGEPWTKTEVVDRLAEMGVIQESGSVWTHGPDARG